MSTALSTQTQARGLALQSFDDAHRFAKMVASSEFAPKDFRGKPESCLLAIQHGSEVGLSPMQSLQSIAVINGRPTIWGDAALALVQSSPVCEYVREYVEGDGDNMAAVCEVKRRGYPSPNVVRFSVADAKKAGLWGKSGPWTQYPQRMLALRARGFALRNMFADALRGLITAEEAQDYPAAEPLTNSVRDPAGITVHHVETFEPQPSVVKAKGKSKPEASPVEQARLAVSAASTFDKLDAVRQRIGKRGEDGTFSAAEVAELVTLCHHRAEMLIGDDAGQEFTTEAARTEALA